MRFVAIFLNVAVLVTIASALINEGFPIDVSDAVMMALVTACLFVNLYMCIFRLNKGKETTSSVTRRRFGIAAVFATIFVAGAVSGYLIQTVVADARADRERYDRQLEHCRSNLLSLGYMLQGYADKYDGTYPPPKKWCDSLIESESDNVKYILICRGAIENGNKGKCHYAINPLCEPNSPPDRVLLFETKGGWNQHGGRELLTFNNHLGNGCNICLNNGEVLFVTPDLVGKLNWGDEQKD